MAGDLLISYAKIHLTIIKGDLSSMEKSMDKWEMKMEKRINDGRQAYLLFFPLPNSICEFFPTQLSPFYPF